MNKGYKAYLFLLLAGSINSAFSMETITPQKLLAMIVSFHNNAFGLNHLFDQPIENKKLEDWLETGQAVKEYTLAHSTDIFGIEDTLLIHASKTIEKANKALVDGIITTYAIKNNTKNLIKMAALFKTIENKMADIFKKLQKATFILNRKKNVQKVLSTLALFIETTAQKANKDTRIGHRTDIKIPTTSYITPKNNYIPLLPPADLPPLYEEEPTETPPTRPAPAIPTQFIPGPPTYMPPTMKEEAERNK